MRTKQAQDWTQVKVSKSNGDYAKLQKMAKVRKLSIPQILSILINQ